MSDLYYIGGNVLGFSISIIFAIICVFIISKLKNKEIKSNSYLINLFLSVGMILVGIWGLAENDLKLLGYILFVLQLILILIGLKDEKVVKYDYYSWITGIASICYGIYVMYEYDEYFYCEFVIIGILWILTRILGKNYTLWKFTGFSILTFAILVVGGLMYTYAWFDWNKTAHIYTDDTEDEFSGKDVELTGTATPNKKIKVYLDGKYYDSTKSDQDGYFSYKADELGNYKFEVNYGDDSDYDETEVKASNEYKKKILKSMLKVNKAKFKVNYYKLGKASEDLAKEELDAWENSDEDPDTIIDNIQNKQKKQVNSISDLQSTLSDNLNGIKKLDSNTYKEYKEYYEKVSKFADLALYPTGTYDEVSDEYAKLDSEIASAMRLMTND